MIYKANESVRKEIYYRIDFALIPSATSKGLELIFKVTSNRYAIPEGTYPCFDEIIFYGISKQPSRIYIENEGDESYEIGYRYIDYDSNTKVLKVQLKERELRLNSLKKYTLILRDI